MLVELRGLLIDKSLVDLGIDPSSSNEIEVRLVFQKSAIHGVREVLDDDGNVISGECIIYTACNETFVVRNSFDELKKIMNDN
jgi:hypothetical protein